MDSRWVALREIIENFYDYYHLFLVSFSQDFSKYSSRSLQCYGLDGVDFYAGLFEPVQVFQQQLISASSP